MILICFGMVDSLDGLEDFKKHLRANCGKKQFHARGKLESLWGWASEE
jgi:hypothetical protein